MKRTPDMIRYGKLQKMMQDIEGMDQQMLMEQLKQLGCTYEFDLLVQKLSNTYNELAVADEIFQNCKIDDANSPYPKEFIDEAMLHIAAHLHEFSFDHYGCISSELSRLLEADHKGKDEVKQMESLFRRLFKTAGKFHLQNLDLIIHEVNDGLDLGSVMVELIDDMLLLGREDACWYKNIINFIDKVFLSFPIMNEYLKQTLLYEQATSYVMMKSKKGEQMFMELLKTSADQTEVVLHYALAYLDDNEAKALRIIKKYKPLLCKESDAYEMIQEISQETGNA